MCGICGFVAPPGAVSPDARVAMRDVLRHRGPDEPGDAELPAGAPDGAARGWFGHRRLRVVDLGPGARQPMTSDDGRVVLTYNGEIYNFAALARELASTGRPVRSSGDTEVVLRAYEQWGDAFLERLDGMFALAVWDARDERLLLARDRTGKKPLFYAHDGDRIAFASEIKGLLPCPWVRRRPDLARLAELLAFGYVPWPHTPVSGVSQVPPGASLVFRAGTLDGARPFWRPLPPAADLRPDDGVVALTAQLLDAAVRRRLVADVPLGALLSGGMDSAVVVALMQRALAEPVQTFSLGFDGDPSFDERSHARRVARRLGTRHREWIVRPDAVALLDRLVWHHDGPFQDSSAIPTYLVAGLAREHVTVVLTGDGGDEVFAGYERFAAAAIARRLPAALAGPGRQIARRLPLGTGYFGVRRRVERFLAGADRPLVDRYLDWVRVFDDDALAAVLDTRPKPVDRGFRAAVGEAADAGLPELDRLLYANFRTYLPDDLHAKVDRMTMAHSLEARSPLLDTALIEHAVRITAQKRIGLRRVKPVLAAAAGDLLDDQTRLRRKHGFGVPLGAWFRGELGTLFADEVLSPSARTASLLRRDGVEALLAAHQAGTVDHSGRLWTVLTLERWLRSLDASPSPVPPAAPAITDAALVASPR